VNNLAAWIDRSNAGPFTNGVRNLNGGIVFDPGFEADYILCINRANLTGSTTFFDLYDMVANTNSFIGNSPSTQFGYQESFTDNDLTKGFEFYIPLSSIGTPVSLKLFGMIVNDPGASAASLISNQFFSVANSGENNYGDGAVQFNAAAPNPVSYVVSQDCYQETCTSVAGSTSVSFNPIPPICYGATAPTLPATSIEGVGGTWSPLPVSNTTTGTYTFTPNAACSSSVPVQVVVYPQVIIDGIYHD
ncbi:MAG: hypothetical protein ACKO7B_20465, partial [Flavobacteriales bacterium]